VDGTAEAFSIKEKKRTAPQRLPGARVHQMVALPDPLFIFQDPQDVVSSLLLPALYVPAAYISGKVGQTAAPAAKTFLSPVMTIISFHFKHKMCRFVGVT
jgi:hypothetical protein